MRSRRPPLDERVFDARDPPIEDVAQRRADTPRCWFGHHAVVELVEAVKLEVVVGDDHEARREASLLGVQNREPRHEGLAAAVAAAEELDGASPWRRAELAVKLAAREVDAFREGVDASLGHEAFGEATRRCARRECS
ncbi:MAG: hypothetical protein R3B99_23865 [Polyangiales bacterium]